MEVKPSQAIWQFVEHLMMETGSFHLEMDINKRSIDGEHPFHDVSDMATSGAMVIRHSALANFATRVIKVDELLHGEEVIIHYENPIYESDVVYLESTIGLSGLVRLHYGYGGKEPLGEEPGCVGVMFHHIVNKWKPVILNEVKSLFVDVYHDGYIEYLEPHFYSEVQKVLFDPKQRAKIIRLEDVSITIYLELSGFYSAELIICKE